MSLTYHDYFPGLTQDQIRQLAALPALYAEWNSKINVVSRKDTDNIAIHHVLHSLAIAKVASFDPGARVMDVGTGGGFPGIPLAILFPEANFTLIDSIGKKLTVASAVADSIGLANVTVFHGRAEAWPSKADYCVSRAVAPLRSLVSWSWSKLSGRRCGSHPSGMFCLKGGDLMDEIVDAARKCSIYEIDSFFDQEYFREKKVIFVPKK